MTRSKNYGWAEMKVGKSVIGDYRKRTAAYMFSIRAGAKFKTHRLPSGKLRITRVK